MSAAALSAACADGHANPSLRDSDGRSRLEGRTEAPPGQIAGLTELHHAEDALRAAKEEAEQASRAKTDFLANVSHEMRTPLNVILGAADLLWESKLDLEQRQYVSSCRRAGANLLTLVNDLLDLSRVEAGHLEWDRAPFDVREVVAQTLEAMAAGAHEKGLDLVGRVSPGVQPRVVGDPARLRQVLVNLLSNGIKFTVRGEVVLDVEPDPRASVAGALLFSVRDTGIGIPAEKLDTIFDRFSQVDASSTRVHGGTGLGLAICRRLVDRMGGRIWAESELGGGTVVRFTARFDAEPDAEPRVEWSLRLGSSASAPSPSSPPPAPESRPVRPLNILLVEDHPDNRLIVQSYLKSSPHRVTVAENGEAAVQAFERGGFDIVLMDMQMPLVDGYEATRRIRAHERENGRKPTPVIALTAHAMSDEVERTKLAGCDAHLSKPLMKSTLLAALEEHSTAASVQDTALSATIDPDLLDLVPGYIQNRFRDLGACRSHLEASRFEDIRVLAHGMAGSGGAYGFDEITRIGRALQVAARKLDAGACKRLLDELDTYVQRIHAAYGGG